MASPTFLESYFANNHLLHFQGLISPIYLYTKHSSCHMAQHAFKNTHVLN